MFIPRDQVPTRTASRKPEYDKLSSDDHDAINTLVHNMLYAMSEEIYDTNWASMKTQNWVHLILRVPFHVSEFKPGELKRKSLNAAVKYKEALSATQAICSELAYIDNDVKFHELLEFVLEQRMNVRQRKRLKCGSKTVPMKRGRSDSDVEAVGAPSTQRRDDNDAGDNGFRIYLNPRLPSVDGLAPTGRSGRPTTRRSGPYSMNRKHIVEKWDRFPLPNWPWTIFKALVRVAEQQTPSVALTEVRGETSCPSVAGERVFSMLRPVQVSPPPHLNQAVPTDSLTRPFKELLYLILAFRWRGRTTSTVAICTVATAEAREASSVELNEKKPTVASPS
ncbi:hypothetical protein F442_19720 [Phytophthora nicotianae P10297]|uniref:Uncharacterized protein n=1 Tax=Phytophthora nicotianae P10297 TaxID=1317064 RepID=W2YB38_PHYNI|nr:hypothetical protein F442_19720 [Phytophthora nicotianae P10297]